MSDQPQVLWYSTLGMHDVEIVGGKNASLGEMISKLAETGVKVPNGYATTAEAYRIFWRMKGWTSKSKGCSTVSISMT